MYAIKNIVYPYNTQHSSANSFIKNKYITRYKDGILISPIDIYGKNKIIRYNNDELIKSIGANAAANANANAAGKSPIIANKTEKDNKAVQAILDNLKIDLNDANKTTVSLYLNITAEKFKVLIDYILKTYKNNGGADDNLNKGIQFISECLYRQGILIKRKDIPSYPDNDGSGSGSSGGGDYIGYVNMFSENNEDDNTYIQYKDKDNKIIKNRNDKEEYFKMIEDRQSKMVRENIKLYNTKTQMEENARPRYITEYFSNRLFKKEYVPHDMSDEETAWGIIIRDKPKKGTYDNTKDKYMFKIFKPVKGNQTGMVCTSFKGDEQNDIIDRLVAADAADAASGSGAGYKDIKKKTKPILCEYIANLLLKQNKLVLYPLYKPKP